MTQLALTHTLHSKTKVCTTTSPHPVNLIRLLKPFLHAEDTCCNASHCIIPQSTLFSQGQTHLLLGPALDVLAVDAEQNVAMHDAAIGVGGTPRNNFADTHLV